MVVLSKIYTRTGDDGTTALGSGRRVAKFDLRVECYGTLDESNAAMGLARLHTRSDQALDAMLARIQNDLFDLAPSSATRTKARTRGGDCRCRMRKSSGSKARLTR
jgi:cob(I)alamin adenosyltransferase